MATRTDAALHPLLVAQDGVVARRQLRDLGLDPRAADRRVATGRWQVLLPQVFLARTGPPTSSHLARAALLYAGPSSALTGRAACRAWQLRDVPDGGPTQLLVPHRRRLVGGPGVEVVRTRHAEPVSRVHGLRVVGRGRAILDAARDGMPLQDVRALVLAAAADGQVTVETLHQVLDRGPGRRSGLLRRALADAARGAASAPEAEAYDLLLPAARRRGLVLLVNPTLLLDGCLLGRVDLYLPALALGLELDSRRHHAGVADLDATLRRHARFARAGVRLLHTTPARLRRRPQEVLAEVLDEVGRPWSVPTSLVVQPDDVQGIPRPHPQA